MTNTLSKTEIKKRSVKGTKWLVVMNGIGMPATSLIALMLGRVGPAALGSYALAQVLIGVVTTFVVYGGKPVLTVFLPKLTDAEDRGRFLFSYALILVGMMTVALGLFWVFPKGFEFLLQREFDMQNYGWFVMLAIVVVASETLANTASGLMLIKTAAIARQMIRLVLLPLVAILFFFRREMLVDYSLPIILGGFAMGYILATVICVLGVSRERRFETRFGWSIPSGFWAFSLSTMAATIFSFLYSNFDRMAVLSIYNVEGLGMYQAVLSINGLLERIPSLLQSSVIPTFSNLLGANHQAAFTRAFAILCRWAVVPITLVSLFVMGFSPEILGLFGEIYVKYAYLLTLFGFVSIIRSMSLPTLTILTCMEENTFRFLQTFLMISAQCILTLAFMSSYGVMAIAGAKMLCVSISAIVAIIYVFFGLGVGKGIPISYRAALLSGALMAILRIWVVPVGWLAATMLTLLCFAVFVVVSKFRLDEVCSILRFVVRHDVDTLSREQLT